MSRTLLIAAAAFAVPASAAFAQALPATAGALAGRSPQASFRMADASGVSCGKTIHSIPAGKLPVYGTRASSQAACQPVTLARADERSANARD